MVVCLVKHDGRAALLGTEPSPNEGSFIEIEFPLEPDMVVAGRRVAEWPEGVHMISDEEAYRFVGRPAKPGT